MFYCYGNISGRTACGDVTEDDALYFGAPLCCRPCDHRDKRSRQEYLLEKFGVKLGGVCGCCHLTISYVVMAHVFDTEPPPPAALSVTPDIDRPVPRSISCTLPAPEPAPLP